MQQAAKKAKEDVKPVVNATANAADRIAGKPAGAVVKAAAELGSIHANQWSREYDKAKADGASNKTAAQTASFLTEHHY